MPKMRENMKPIDRFWVWDRAEHGHMGKYRYVSAEIENSTSTNRQLRKKNYSVVTCEPAKKRTS